ncbi:hypothetical protein ROHU_005862 [Labeo rohita]|uniref:Uncharacterized protein n=1 Tax=Labeo rohita TaxID=84645 RepID=A0A498N9A1_LABRO|nr:hypothetical protein ROHU_005862 [Labeo rohita]
MCVITSRFTKGKRNPSPEGVCALWDRGGPYRTIRHRDRSVASSASKCDIPQCTRPPEPGRAVHTHCPDPGHTSGGEDDMTAQRETLKRRGRELGKDQGGA